MLYHVFDTPYSLTHTHYIPIYSLIWYFLIYWVYVIEKKVGLKPRLSFLGLPRFGWYLSCEMMGLDAVFAWAFVEFNFQRAHTHAACSAVVAYVSFDWIERTGVFDVVHNIETNMSHLGILLVPIFVGLQVIVTLTVLQAFISACYLLYDCFCILWYTMFYFFTRIGGYHTLCFSCVFVLGYHMCCCHSYSRVWHYRHLNNTRDRDEGQLGRHKY